MKKFLIVAVTFFLAGCSSIDSTKLDYNKQWPQFRGPYASGIVESQNIPDTWDVSSGNNIKWKTKIRGLGNSSPVIWGDKIFVTTAISSSGKDSIKVGLYGDIDNFSDSSVHEFRLICINKHNGKVLWDRLACKDVPRTKRHTKATHADPTPATNGKYVVAFFGSNGLYCYSMNGNLKWKKDFGKMNSGFYPAPEIEWDISSSPIIYDNTLIVQCDYLGGGFIKAIDIETGIEKWSTPRNEVSTYSAPTVYYTDSLKYIIANGYEYIGGYDFETGKQIWNLSGGGDIPVPTPFYSKGLIYIHSAHGKNFPVFAVKANAKGDISLPDDSTANQFVAWRLKRSASYINTGLVYGDFLYILSDGGGRLSCYEASTGNKVYVEKIQGFGAVTASGVASNGKLYYSNENGDVVVIKAGKEFEIIAKNSLGETVMATPAISSNMLIYRTLHSLIAIAQK